MRIPPASRFIARRKKNARACVTFVFTSLQNQVLIKIKEHTGVNASAVTRTSLAMEKVSPIFVL